MDKQVGKNILKVKLIFEKFLLTLAQYTRINGKVGAIGLVRAIRLGLE
jgi:hypothetical protein